jgi:hypothetical protein
MDRPRAADDFAAIRARMEELKREREREQAAYNSPKERPDEKRWRTSDELRTRVTPRSNGRAW